MKRSKINDINPKSIEGVKNFYKVFQQLDWFDNDCIGCKIKYFKTEAQLLRYIIENEGFGVFHFNNSEQELVRDEYEEYEQEVTFKKYLVDHIKNVSNLEWSGEGYYISWCWAEDHIERIDIAYSNLIPDLMQRIEDRIEEEFVFDSKTGYEVSIGFVKVPKQYEPREVRDEEVEEFVDEYVIN